MSSYPGVTVRILDESLTRSTSELNSPAVGAMLGQGGTLSMKLFSKSATETAQGYYYVENLNLTLYLKYSSLMKALLSSLI
jgi:hypothetical protein